MTAWNPQAARRRERIGQLDAIGRTRALTDAESRRLEQLLQLDTKLTREAERRARGR